MGDTVQVGALARSESIGKNLTESISVSVIILNLRGQARTPVQALNIF